MRSTSSTTKRLAEEVVSTKAASSRHANSFGKCSDAGMSFAAKRDAGGHSSLRVGEALRSLASKNPFVPNIGMDAEAAIP